MDKELQEQINATGKRTDAELRQIAKDMLAGDVFTTQHDQILKDPTLMEVVFMPLAFMTKEQHEEFWGKKPGLIYERTEKAFPRIVNGCLIFTSFQWIGMKEYEKVMKYFVELIKAKKVQDA